MNMPQDETRLLTNGPSHDDDNDIPSGWFIANDPQSGEPYYVNEQTGETTWDRPTAPNHTPLLTNQPASEDESSLASGWFAVVEPSSGDIYYANEETGETSWDKPLSLRSLSMGRANSQQSSAHGMSKMSLSMHDNTVFEDDSVTSSQY
jgi:outer membrane protein assembly factor BamB